MEEVRVSYDTSAKCFRCGSPASTIFGNGYLCDECIPKKRATNTEIRVEVDNPTNPTSGSEDKEATIQWRNCLREALQFFHEQLDATIADHTDDNGAHPERPTTGREYFENVRGWEPETIEAELLGWAPPGSAVVDQLQAAGYRREEILATGLFTEDLRPLWQGRYIFPYFNSDGEPVYAISRGTGSKGGGKAGYDGHPADFISGKYAKPAHTKDYARVGEPIYGAETVEDGQPLLITEGIADAITAHQAGYPCISPVTTRFKARDHDALLEVIEGHNVPRVYIVQDSEPPKSEPRDVDDAERITDALTINQHGPGLSGAIDTGRVLKENDVDARIAELPLPARSEGFHKVDLDDYLTGWNNDLTSVLASATAATAHPAYVPENDTQMSPTLKRDRIEGTGGGSALFDITIEDVTRLSDGYRGESPLGHHGNSGNYFKINDGLAYDHKYKVGYNALTFLLCEAGIRRDNDPSGPVSNRELLEVWSYAKRKGIIPDDDPIPYSALLHVVVAEEVCDRDDLPSSTNESLPQDVYNATLQAIETEYDLNPGRDYVTGRDADETEPTVVLDPAVAWRAASTVTPGDLDGELSLETTDEGDAWQCPVTDTSVDVIRAVAIDEEVIGQPEEPLCDDDYDAAYRIARNEYGASLPQYVTAATATDRWHVIQGALEQFTHRHLSGVKSDVTGLGDSKRVLAELNPCWTDSASERRIIALKTGGFYCRKHKRPIDPLRFVALESGVIDICEDELSGEAFKQAYHIAREEYGAPLPEWTVGDPEYIPVLPPADTLVGEFSTESKSLDDTRADVEALYRDLADDTGMAHVLNALPALGKTTSVVKNADEYPALYLGPRKELQEEVAQKAENYGVSYYHLPVFTERRIAEKAKRQALAIVREEGKDVLKDRDDLVSRLDHPVFSDEEDEAELERESCPTANGEYGEAWALVLQVARELDYTPKEILTRPKALFGEELPGDGPDPYSQAWERVTDSENPIDLLIGGYGYAHVGGARTYYGKDGDRYITRPRAVVIDEFPGLDPYETKFGERYLDHAAWLARCLRDDIDDRKALFQADLWDDEWVRAWLEGNGSAIEDIDQAQATHETMQNASAVLEVVTDVLDTDVDAVRSLGLSKPLQDIVNCHPEWDPEDVERVYQILSRAVDRMRADTSTEAAVLNRLADDVLSSLATVAVARKSTTDPLTAGAVPERVSGELSDLCETAEKAFVNDRDEAYGLLAATQDALEGGEDGCRALAVHAHDGYAHPSAHLLLYGEVAEGDDVTTVQTEAFTFGDDETNIDRMTCGRATLLVDRNQHGAVIHQPPKFVADDGSKNAVIGLDATATRRLWNLAIGRDVDIADVHETPRHRRQFLRDVLNLQIVQTTPHVNSYSGSPAGKNFDGDVALVETVAAEYGAQAQLRQDKLTSTTNPGVITTKKVREEIEDRLEGTVGAIDNYGNVTGSNALGECNVGVVLGARHYGDTPVEKWAALSGEEVSRNGHGNDLDYGCPTGNAVLRHMRDDETMQAVLRFGRDEEGAIVFAHTSALRDDLPVVGEGAIVQAHSKSAKAVAKVATRFRRQKFAISDLVDEVDCSRRTIRRVLAGFADVGYLERHETKNGVANEYRMQEDPGPGEVELPDVSLNGNGLDETTLREYYTWNVRVDTEELGIDTPIQHSGTTLPAPEPLAASPPPD